MRVIKSTASLDIAFEVELPPAPYPGMRPFEKQEWPIFFGREELTDEVIRRLGRQDLFRLRQELSDPRRGARSARAGTCQKRP